MRHSNLKAVVEEVTGQIALRAKFLEGLAILSQIGNRIGVRIIAKEVAGAKKKVKPVAKKQRKAKQPVAKRKLSKEGREAIAKGQRARWARVKAEKKKAAN